jgi:hypothetical protein
MARIKKEQTVLREIQDLLKEQDKYRNKFTSCANYENLSNGIKYYCSLEKNKEKSCSYFLSEDNFERCTYFENAVLPVDGVLMARYYNWLDINVIGYVKNICLKCKSLFLDLKKKDFCCEDCAEKAKKEKGKLVG